MQEYLNFKNAIGDTSDNAVRGAALLKQGFTEATQVTGESIKAVYADMKKLGEDNGVEDAAKNAIEGTSIYAAGFNTLEDVINAGDEGINKFLSNAKELYELDGLFTDDMSLEQKSAELTNFAQQIGLIPEEKSVRIDVDTGETTVINDVTKKINDVWGSGDKTLNVTVNTNVAGDDIDDYKSKVDSLDNKDCKITFNADGSPARAVINDVTYNLKDYDESTGTAVLYAEDGNAVGTIDLISGKIDLVPNKKVITFEANYAGTKGIEEYAAVIEELKGHGAISFNIDANGNTEILNEVGDVVARLEKDSNIIFHIGADGNLEVLNTLTHDVQVLDKYGNVVLNVYASVENFGEVKGLQGELAELNGQNCYVTFYADGTPAIATIGETKFAIGNYDGTTGTATLYAENGSAVAAINTTTNQILGIPNKEAYINANVSGRGLVQSLVDAINNTNSKSVSVSATTSGLGAVQSLKNAIGSITSKTVDIVANVFGFGGSDVDGTAHVGGTAFARGTAGTAFKSGTWGTKNSGVALGGELGEELVVRNGKFFTIGSESAEMFAYQKGDIIFNAEQTKQIFEKGKITHGNRRGKAFSTGTAFASGSESAEHFDWIETLDDRTERSISRFTDRFKSAYLTLTNRFVNWGNALSETTKQIDFKQQAYDRYMEQANAVGLDESWAAKVRNGELDISTVTDDDLKEKIKDYEEWFEKALDCKDAIDELHESVAELYTDNFKNIETEYENVLSEIEHRANMLNEYVDRAEEKGLAGSTRYYTALQAAETEKLSQLKREQTDLINALNEAVNSGEIEIYSEAWYELQGSINEVTEAIEESKTALAEFDNQMRQVTWDRFDYMQDSLTQLTDESDFLIDLLSNRELYNAADPEVREIISSMQENSSLWHSASSTEKDSLERQNRNYAKRIANITGKNVEIDDNGVWWIDNQQLYSLNNDNYGGLSDAGMSILGLHGLNYNAYMEQSKAYANELASIDKQLAESPYDTNLIERRRELLKLQRESILAAEDEKQAMIDLVKDGIEQQADALKELIDAYIDSLDSAKDLYDYQKKVKKHTQDIASLEKQLAAYQNDTSEETKSKIQQIKVDLEEAREDLQDTEYDKYISDQKELLNDLYDEYQSLMDERLTDIDVSIDKLIGEVNDSASIISNTLTKETSEVGTALSSEMNSIWTSERQALTTYFGDTGIILNGVSGYFENTNTALTGINGAVNSILAGVNNIVEYASYQAKADIDPEGSKNQMIQNSMDWWATDDESVRNELASENEKYGEALGYTKNDGSWYDSDGNLAYKVTNEDNIRNIVSKMKANSEAWHGASDSKRAELSSANEKYAQKIQSLTDRPVYKDGNGVWWIGDRELYSYRSGGIADFTGAAWLDGTPSKPEMVLNAKDTENFIALKDTLKHMSEQDLSLADIGYRSMDITRLSGLTDISSMLYTLRQTNNSGSGNTIGGIEINIPIDHVDGYNDFITQLQKDKQFERFVRSVSVDLLSGGSSLAKNKYKW